MIEIKFVCQLERAWDTTPVYIEAKVVREPEINQRYSTYIKERSYSICEVHTYTVHTRLREDECGPS